MNLNREKIARWETRGEDFLELYRDEWGPYSGYGYTGNGCFGWLGEYADDDWAIRWMESHAVAVLKSDLSSPKLVWRKP